jgi:hypothetical protein
MVTFSCADHARIMHASCTCEVTAAPATPGKVPTTTTAAASATVIRIKHAIIEKPSLN